MLVYQSTTNCHGPNSSATSHVLFSHPLVESSTCAALGVPGHPSFYNLSALVRYKASSPTSVPSGKQPHSNIANWNITILRFRKFTVNNSAIYKSKLLVYQGVDRLELASCNYCSWYWEHYYNPFYSLTSIFLIYKAIWE